MRLELSPELEEIVERKMRSGIYGSANEVVEEALTLLVQRDRAFAISDIAGAVEVGWQSAERDDLLDGDEVFARLDTEITASEQHLRG